MGVGLLQATAFVCNPKIRLVISPASLSTRTSMTMSFGGSRLPLKLIVCPLALVGGKQIAVQVIEGYDASKSISSIPKYARSIRDCLIHSLFYSREGAG